MKVTGTKISLCAATVCVAASALICLFAWRELRDVYSQLRRLDG